MSIDLSKSNGLFLAPQGAVGSSSFRTSNNYSNSSSKNTIYSLNPDNTITEVSTLVYKNPKTGKTINHKHTEQIQPTGVYDTKNFILISYNGVYKGSKRCSIVPVRKSDGALFCLDIFPRNSDSNFENIQSDSSGTIIVINHDLGLSRLDLSDPNNPTIKELTSFQNKEFIYNFVINSDGDALAIMEITNTRILKVFDKNSGESKPFSYNNLERCLINGVIGDESSFYFSEYTNNGNIVLQKIIKLNGKYIKETYSNENVYNYYDCNSIARTKRQNLFQRA